MQAIKEEFGGRIGEVRENGSLTKSDISSKTSLMSLLCTPTTTLGREESYFYLSPRAITGKLCS